VILLEARRAEDRYTRADEVEGAEATNEFDHDAQRPNELRAAGLRALEEAPNLRGRPMPPGLCGDRLPVGCTRNPGTGRVYASRLGTFASSGTPTPQLGRS
jgi:hypothetical protein